MELREYLSLRAAEYAALQKSYTTWLDAAGGKHPGTFGYVFCGALGAFCAHSLGTATPFERDENGRLTSYSILRGENPPSPEEWHSFGDQARYSAACDAALSGDDASFRDILVEEAVDRARYDWARSEAGREYARLQINAGW